MTISEKTSSRLRECALAFLALLLIGGALATTFSHVLQSGSDEISGRYDVYRYYGPITFYFDYCVSQGELPLWNPLVYCGLPNAANPQAFVFYPLNLLRSLLLSEISPQSTLRSLIGFMGLHLLFMGLCTYLLGRAHKLSFPGALVAALAWVCSALIVRRAGEFHFLYTIAWLPLILLFVKAAIDAPTGRKRLAHCTAAGVFLGISILGGFLQIVSYLGVCIGIYALVYRVVLPHATTEPTGSPGIRGFSREVLAFGAIFLFAVVIGMALLLPVAELTGFSARQKGMPVPMYSDLMKWDVTRLYQSLVVFAGMKYEAETLRGAGIIVFLLAIAGCFHRNRRLVGLFALLTYVLVDCGFGPPFPIASLVNALTPFSASAYSRGFDFALLPLGLLAGLGVDALWHGRGSRPAQILMSLLLVYGAAGLIIPLVQWTSPHPYLPVTKAVYLLPAVAALAMLAIGWTPRSWQRSGMVLLLLFPALLFAETWSWNRHYVPWMIKKEFRDAQPIQQADHAFPTTNQRSTDPIANRGLYSLRPAMNGVDPLHFADVRNFLSGTPRDKRSHRLVTDWEPTAENHRGNLLLKRYFWLSRYAVEGPLPDKQTPFPATTTTYLNEGSTVDFPPPPGRGAYGSVSPQAKRVEIPGMDALLARQRSGNQRQVRFDLELPSELDGVKAGSAGVLASTLVIEYRSTLAAQVDTRFTDPRTGLRHWGKRHRVDNSRNVLKRLEVPMPDLARSRAEISLKPEGAGTFHLDAVYLMVDKADEDGLIAINTFRANTIELEVGPLPGPRLLTFLDAWYPGWHAYVDGQEVFVLQADDVFKAIPILEGNHTVRFEFRPRTVTLGMATSIAGFVLALGLIAGLVFKREQPPVVALKEALVTPPVSDRDPE